MKPTDVSALSQSYTIQMSGPPPVVIMPQKGCCAMITSFIFNTILFAGSIASLISGISAGDISRIIGGIVFVAINLFVYFCLFVSYETWTCCRCFLKALFIIFSILFGLLLIAFIVLLAAFDSVIDIGDAGLTLVIVLGCILILLAYGIYLGALLPAIKLYSEDTLAVTPTSATMITTTPVVSLAPPVTVPTLPEGSKPQFLKVAKVEQSPPVANAVQKAPTPGQKITITTQSKKF